MITLALPTYNSSPILWLALESLCRQETQYEWELIICEDPSDNFAGESYITPYKDRLKQAGCSNISYLELESWIPLSQKWKIIAEHATWENFLLVASDNYSAPDRIEVSVSALKDYDWVDYSQGLFLNVLNWDQAIWKRWQKNMTGLYMGTKTHYIKKLHGPYPKKNIDNWIRSQQNITNRKHIEEFPLGIHTDGFNNISFNRKQAYGKHHIPNNAFFTPPSNVKVENILPLEVVERLKTMSK